MRLRALKNVLANWLGLGTTMVVGFLLTPFILHKLGDTAFGLWVLLTTFTGYYGLLDLGLRNSIIVQTDDATLVAHKSQAQKVKELVKKLGEDPKLRKLV